MVQQATSDPASVITRLQQAINQHDLDAFVACFAPDYRSEQPLHPADSYTGRDRVRQHWASAFHEIPDIQVDLVRCATTAAEAWTEWYWRGTWANGTPLSVRGVIIFGIDQELIAWGRLYMLPEHYTLAEETYSFAL